MAFTTYPSAGLGARPGALAPVSPFTAAESLAVVVSSTPVQWQRVLTPAAISRACSNATRPMADSKRHANAAKAAAPPRGAPLR